MKPFCLCADTWVVSDIYRSIFHSNTELVCFTKAELGTGKVSGMTGIKSQIILAMLVPSTNGGAPASLSPLINGN